MHAAGLIRAGVYNNTSHRHRFKLRVSVVVAQILHDPVTDGLRRRNPPFLHTVLLKVVRILDWHLELDVLDHGVFPVLERRLVVDRRRGVRRQYLLEDLLRGGGLVNDGAGQGGGVRRQDLLADVYRFCHVVGLLDLRRWYIVEISVKLI